MKYLPFEKYTLSSSLSIPEAQQRIFENLEPTRTLAYLMKNKTKPFTGSVYSGGFRIQRVIRYRNS